MYRRLPVETTRPPARGRWMVHTGTMTGVPEADAAYERRAWAEAFAALGAADHLDADGHERLAVCAHLVGDDQRCVQAWQDAHRAFVDRDEPGEAARCAFWLALGLMLRGQMAQAGGWLARAERLVALDPGSAAAGYLLVPQALGALDAGDPATAERLASRAADVGVRLDDADLLAFGTLGRGQALIATGDIAAGTACLDDVMVSVTAGDVGPIATGIVYCAVVLECFRMFDLRRAREWTDALSEWCDAQPDLVPYRGQCLVHRSQLAQVSGDWTGAITAAEDACARLIDPPHPALGAAYYQEAELHRLIGAFDRAASEYREASRNGHDPMPGLALLELARGDPGAAAASIRRALQESSDPAERPGLLAAAVEILVTTDDVGAARAAADELATIASGSRSRLLEAMASHATGSVLVAEGEHGAALSQLRAAGDAWRALAMPYEAAKASVLVARACSALGDGTTAAMELGHARDTFARLGAIPDLDRTPAPAEADGRDGAAEILSGREREVLGHVAAGATNRQIAEALSISQHTVDRHLENIFAKLGVNNRAAATAWAYRHDLL